MGASRKQISFDLDTKKLKKYYPSSNWRKAYEDIKEFMYENNFSWIQGSVYTSNNPMYENSVRQVIKLLLETLSYLNLSIRDIVVTNIGKSHNYNYLLDLNIQIDNNVIAENEEILKNYSNINSDIENIMKKFQEPYNTDENELEL